jgi:hypothetical protein
VAVLLGGGVESPEHGEAAGEGPPRVQLLPSHSNVFLTHQHGPDIPPPNCFTSTDTAVLRQAVSAPIKSLDPKGSGATQVLAAFEFEIRFDPGLVCVNVVPGPAWQGTGTSCLTIPSEPLPGIARLSCFAATGHEPPGNAGLHVANVIVRPQPALYSQIMPSQENAVLAQLVNTDCELADEQGHAILVQACDGADVTIRALEADIDADCDVDVVDGQILAFYWGRQYSIWPPDLRHDLEPPGGDGDIDIRDIQFVWGRHGSTCANPNSAASPPRAEVVVSSRRSSFAALGLAGVLVAVR